MESGNRGDKGSSAPPPSVIPSAISAALNVGDLAKVVEAKRISLEVGAGLNYVRPRAKPYYCYRRFKKRMGQKRDGDGSTSLSSEGSLSGGEGGSGLLGLKSESGELSSMVRNLPIICLIVCVLC